MIRLPGLISDGMVVQTGRDVHLWGWSEPGEEIGITVQQRTGGSSNTEESACAQETSRYEVTQQIRAKADEKGRFDGYLAPLQEGAVYRFCFLEKSTEVTVENVVAGYVFFCSGQSNMELPMRRVADHYPQEMISADDPLIRTYKIIEQTSYRGPLKDLESGSWVSVNSRTIADFSATAYFFAKEFRRTAGCPVGLINASLGGSRIVGWMSREMLQGYDDLLAEADRYSNPDFYEGQIRNNELQAKAWYQNLDDMDPGRAHHWEEGTDDMAEGQVPSVIQVPVMFRDTALAGFCGSIWFRKKFRAGDEWSEKAARLWLGTIVDRDEVWLNGVFLGRTEYQYPPRKYDVPAGVIRGGDNSLVVRVVVDQGLGRFTPDKYYCLFEAGCSSPEEGGRIELSGQWEYWAGARCGRAPETDFVNWKATGLYNAMTAPCHDYPVAAVLWYQGESDTHEPYDYAEMTRRQIAGYRACWKDDLLPYIFVQLPRFSIDLDSDTQWPDLREKQRSALAVPGTAMAVAYDLGEDNDLHPLEKKELGRRMALLALTRCCGYQLEDSGPVPVRAVYYHEADTVRVRISLRHAKGLHTGPAEPGKDDGITDFEVLDTSGNHIVIRQVRVLAEEDAVELVCDGRPGCLEETLRGGNYRLSPGMIRYLYTNTNRGRMLYNSDRLPMGPFCMECTED